MPAIPDPRVVGLPLPRREYHRGCWPWNRLKLWLRRRRHRRNGPEVAPSGWVRGWHRDCPMTSPGMLGTYALVPDGEGGVTCAACGTGDLVPRRELE